MLKMGMEKNRSCRHERSHVQHVFQWCSSLLCAWKYLFERGSREERIAEMK